MPSGKWRPFCLGLNVLIHDEYLQKYKNPPQIYVTSQDVCTLRVLALWDYPEEHIDRQGTNMVNNVSIAFNLLLDSTMIL